MIDTLRTTRRIDHGVVFAHRNRVLAGCGDGLVSKVGVQKEAMELYERESMADPEELMVDLGCRPIVIAISLRWRRGDKYAILVVAVLTVLWQVMYKDSPQNGEIILGLAHEISFQLST